MATETCAHAVKDRNGSNYVHGRTQLFAWTSTDVPRPPRGGGDQALEEDTELEAMEDEEVVEGEVSVAEGMGFQEEVVAGQEQLL